MMTTQTFLKGLAVVLSMASALALCATAEAEVRLQRSPPIIFTAKVGYDETVLILKRGPLKLLFRCEPQVDEDGNKTGILELDLIVTSTVAESVAVSSGAQTNVHEQLAANEEYILVHRSADDATGSVVSRNGGTIMAADGNTIVVLDGLTLWHQAYIFDGWGGLEEEAPCGFVVGAALRFNRG